MTDKRSELINLIGDQGIVPLYYSPDPQVSIDLMKALYRGGIRTTEYADRGENALKNFKVMRKVCDDELPGMYLGIGTVKNAESAQKYVDEGAEFIICPGMMEPVAKIAEREKLLCVPGCMTPTDILQAEALGATIIKLFPANTLTPAYIEAIKAIFPGLQYIPTGGIVLTEENLTGWIRAGVIAVGGSKLLTKSVIDNRLYDDLARDAKEALMLFRTVRNKVFPDKMVSSPAIN